MKPTGAEPELEGGLFLDGDDPVLADSDRASVARYTAHGPVHRWQAAGT